MPAAQEIFHQAVNNVLETAMFENWLRFYFIHEKQDQTANGPELTLELPVKSLERIRELYPDLYPLAEKLNGKHIDFETSRDAVLAHILNHVDGKTIARGEAQRAMQSRTFQVKLQMFHTWEQMHEDQLDHGFMEFGAWRSLFAKWLETPGARELAKKLMNDG